MLTGAIRMVCDSITMVITADCTSGTMASHEGSSNFYLIGCGSSSDITPGCSLTHVASYGSGIQAEYEGQQPEPGSRAYMSVPKWMPVSVISGGAAANSLVENMDTAWGRRLYGKLLIKQLANGVYKVICFMHMGSSMSAGSWHVTLTL